MIAHDLLEVSRTAAVQFPSAHVLERDESGIGLGPDDVESRNNESPSRLWAINSSPAIAKFSSTASPILRFALNSPGNQFQSSDYINKLLGEDPLLRSPTGEGNNLIVDSNGELVLPDGDSPMGASGFTSYGNEVGASAGASDSAGLSSGVGGAFGSHNGGLLLEEKKGEQMLDFILPQDAGSSRKTEGDQNRHVQQRQSHGLSAPRVPTGAAATVTHANRGGVSKVLGPSNRHKGIVKSEKKNTAAARVGKTKAAAVSRPARASALPSAAERSKKKQVTTLSALHGGIGGSGKAGGSHARTADQAAQAALNKLAIFSGTKRFRGAAGGVRKNNESEQAVKVPHYTEEELKRIRRVKNRASVEKCRTKQRKRMESLEIELQMLHEENNTLLAVTKCVVSSFDIISRDVVAITGSKPVLHG